jgi:hypothetical protein
LARLPAANACSACSSVSPALGHAARSFVELGGRRLDALDELAVRGALLGGPAEGG